MRQTKRMRGRRSGFTLLEILIVVAIIAMLAAFVVPNFMGTQLKAQIDLTQSKVAWGGPVGSALELYRTHIGTYPDDLKGLTEKPDDDEKAQKWATGGYLQDAGQLKDAWGKELMYKFPGQFNQDRYDLWSVGPDGQDGTDDDIGNWKKG